MHIAETLLSFETCIAHYTENTNYIWNMQCTLRRSTTRLWNMYYSLWQKQWSHLKYELLTTQ